MRKSPADYQVAKCRPIQFPTQEIQDDKGMNHEPWSEPKTVAYTLMHIASKELYLKRISIWLCALYGVSSAQQTSTFPQRWLHMRRPIILPPAKEKKRI